MESMKSGEMGQIFSPWVTISTFHFVLAGASRVSEGSDQDKPSQDVYLE